MRAKGFTFVELLLALALMALLIPAASEALALAAKRSAQVAANTVPESETALAVLRRDLRCAFLSATDAGTVFVARSDNGFGRLDFFRITGPVEFYVRQNELWRSESGQALRLCGGVSEFDVKSFDGETWRKEWGWDPALGAPTTGIRGLPLLLSVHLVADGRETNAVLPLLTPLLRKSLHG